MVLVILLPHGFAVERLHLHRTDLSNLSGAGFKSVIIGCSFELQENQ